MTEDKPSTSLNELDAKLRKARSAREPKTPKTGRGSVGGGLALGMRLALDIVAAVGIGAGIGYGLDWWLGTNPWLFILFFFLGAAAGISNAFRTAGGYGASVGYKGSSATRSPSGDRDEKS